MNAYRIIKSYGIGHWEVQGNKSVTVVLKLLINQTKNCESDSNFEFNFILIFYIESKINFRHEMSTVYVENSKFKFYISIIYELVLSEEINQRHSSSEDLEIIIFTQHCPQSSCK